MGQAISNIILLRVKKYIRQITKDTISIHMSVEVIQPNC